MTETHGHKRWNRVAWPHTHGLRRFCQKTNVIKGNFQNVSNYRTYRHAKAIASMFFQAKKHNT